MPMSLPPALPPAIALERRRLARLRKLAVMDTGPEPVFDALARIAASICAKPIALVSLVDERRQWFKANHGLPGVQEISRDIAFCARAIEQDGVMEVCDAMGDARFTGNPLVVHDPGIRFYAGAPIVMPSGERVGTLCVMDRKPGHLAAEQAAALRDLAAVAQWALLQRERANEFAAVDGESRLRAVSSALPLGVFQADQSGAFFDVNDLWQELFGMDAPRALGSGWLDSVHRRDRDRVLAVWEACVANATPFDQEFRVWRGKGDIAHVRMQARCGICGDPPRRGYVGVAVDITQPRSIEQHLRSANSFLERAERLSGVGGWEADLKTRQVKWTDQNCRIYDLEPGHQPGFTEHLRYFGETERRIFEQTAERAIRTGESWDLELPMLTAKGRAIWVKSVGCAEFDDDGGLRLVGALQDITAQKTAKDELRAANELLNSVMESLPCGLSVFDGDLHLIAHNRQFRTLQDFPDSLFAGPVVTFESLIRHNALRGEYGSPPQEKVRAIVERAKSPQPHHIQRSRPGGVTLDIRGAPLSGGGFVTTYVDVSAAKAAEQALRESEERQTRALEASRLALWDFDLESGHVYLSENWSELMGGPRRSTVTTSKALALLVPEHDQTGVADALKAMLKGTSDRYEVEHQVRKEDGSLIWVHSEGRVTRRNEQGRAVRATGTNQDITTRKQAQEQAARAAAITRATLESTADGIVVVTMEREILLFNQQFLTMWNFPGTAPEEAANPQPRMLAHVQAQVKDSQEFLRRLRELHEGPGVESFDVVELLDGRVFEQYGRHMEVGGAAIGRVWSFRDVTARHLADAEIKRAKEAAEAANRAKTEFLNTVSHEIRTPLNGVLGMTRLLLADTLTGQQRKYLELADSSAQSLLGLINDLLDLGKIEAGRIEFERVPFSPAQLVAGLAELYGVRAREKGLAFKLLLAPGVPVKVAGDPGRLRQILENLLSNALKFTRSGEISLELECLGAEPDAVMLGFSIRDSGIGIPAEVRQRLFSRFVQADSSTTRQYGGTGLGLAIVRQLCAQMGGGVTLESGAGGGSCFRCEIPFGPVSAQEDTAASAGPTPASQAWPRAARNGRILVAEDNSINQIVVRGMLLHAGYPDVTVVEDGRQALDAVAGGNFDAVLMDCHMPVMDGYEATARLRAAGCAVPIIALTANASAAEQQRCLGLGMNDFLSKPVDVKRLAQVLDRWTGAAAAAPDEHPVLALPADEAAKSVFGRQKALGRMDGDEELFARVLDAFRTQSPQVMAQVHAALERGEAAEVQRQLHSLAGSSAMVGAELLGGAIRAMEQLAAQGNLSAVARDLPALAARIDEFMAGSATLAAGGTS